MSWPSRCLHQRLPRQLSLPLNLRHTRSASGPTTAAWPTAVPCTCPLSPSSHFRTRSSSCRPSATRRRRHRRCPRRSGRQPKRRSHSCWPLAPTCPHGAPAEREEGRRGHHGGIIQGHTHACILPAWGHASNRAWGHASSMHGAMHPIVHGAMHPACMGPCIQSCMGPCILRAWGPAALPAPASST